jgi:N-acetyl-anhydromuramyl-L-alanine amidase AmpD
LDQRSDPEIKKQAADTMSEVSHWYDLADCSHGQMKTQGQYKNLYPVGAIVHFTAGRSRNEKDAENMTRLAQERGHCYFVIGPTGKVYQSFPLTHWGYHAGPSQYGLLGGALSRSLVGIELTSAGKLAEAKDGLVSWFGERINPTFARLLPERRENAGKGYYHKYTPEQEDALIKLCLWLHRNNPDVFKLDNVLGHCEVAMPRGRKVDPGGALSMSMAEFRELLKSK